MLDQILFGIKRENNSANNQYAEKSTQTSPISEGYRDYEHKD